MHGGVDPKADVGDVLAATRGQNGIDAIYKDKDGNYIIVETKASTGSSAGSLSSTNNGQQMSKQWIEKNLRDAGWREADISKVIDGISGDPPTTKLLKAELVGAKPGGEGIAPDPEAGELKFFELTTNGNSSVSVNRNAEWTP